MINSNRNKGIFGIEGDLILSGSLISGWIIGKLNCRPPFVCISSDFKRNQIFSKPYSKSPRPLCQVRIDRWANISSPPTSVSPPPSATQMVVVCFWFSILLLVVELTPIWPINYGASSSGSSPESSLETSWARRSIYSPLSPYVMQVANFGSLCID